MNKVHFIISLLVLKLTTTGYAQEITGIIQGKVTDGGSETPISFANVGILDDNLNKGTISNEDGEFLLENVPVGRYQIQISFVGYETVILNDVLVTSGNNPPLNIRLKESSLALDEVVVRQRQVKEKPLNSMAMVSARQLNMEEANRFAGGFDDPARLVTSFAGVASGSGDNNAFSVRGNSPKGTLWQIEGVPVHNPNHFGEITGFGGGGITALSSKTIGNSDFFMGAFPAEYGNALSSVFDLNIRNGNSSEYHHSFQFGFFGIDVGSEGPIKKSTNASYLANYRYSTLGLLGLGLNYQDLSFKINLPTKKAGTFSIWGLGLIDATSSMPDADTVNTENPVDEDVKWKYYDDIATEKANISTGIGGITHKVPTNKNGYLKTTASVSFNEIKWKNSRLDSAFSVNYPLNKTHYTQLDYRLSSVHNQKVDSWHTNRTGMLLTNLNYRFDIKNALSFGDPLTTIASDNGSSNLLQAFTQSSFSLGKVQINPGIHVLYFTLNDETTVEPRLGADYNINTKTKISLGYGLHSQIEKLSFYLADVPIGEGTEQLNKNMGLTKSHHLIFAFDRMFGSHTHLRIEPYYQYLYNVPVIDNTYFSMLNLNYDFFINQQLVNKGTGENIGIDMTFERFMHKGVYYLTTLSVFDSKYTDGSGIERPTRFNRKLIGNFLIGKEWLMRKKNLFSANLRYTYLGGTWTHPVDESASLAAKEIVEDYSGAFSIQNPTSHVVSFTLTYRVNGKKTSSLWSLQMLNVSGAKEYLGYQYNFRDHSIDKNTDVIVLPNLSYRIEF